MAGRRMRESLTEIANRYGTDKGTLGPSARWQAHNYTDVYEPYLAPLRDQEVRILEIGLGVLGDQWQSNIVHGRNTGGASVQMWRDFFPRATVFGIDINPCSYLDDDRIQTFVVDQGDRSSIARFLDRIDDGFDVIVDDGSHRPDHQQVSLSTLFPRLRRGGLYFIEDLLANGAGDRATGRMASSEVLNTRRVLKRWSNDRTFDGPNALSDEQALSETIASIRFHKPASRTKLAFRARVKWPMYRIRQFASDSERLCVIRKR